MNGADGTQTRSVQSAVTDLLGAQLRLGRVLASSLLGRTGKSSCDIPTPCWEPQPLGTCELALRPGGAATITFQVLNCNWKQQTVVATATDKLAGWLTFTPTTLVLDPQERGTITVTVQVPANAKLGESVNGPIVLQGCKNHFLRVELRVAERTDKCECEVQVRDCPDHIHHWYDHFYCLRMCRDPVVGKPTQGKRG